MNALERAKAFVNSRAAKTALKIMPLAVAAVVTVGAPPTAKAAALSFGQDATGWLNNCSGGNRECLGANANDSTQTPTIMADFTNPNNPDTFQSASGLANGWFTNKGGLPFDLQMFMTGPGSGDLSNPSYVEAQFNVSCPGCDSSDTFAYRLDVGYDTNTGGGVDNGKFAYTASTGTTTFTPGTFDIFLPAPKSSPTCNYTVDPCPTDLTNYSVTIDFFWEGQSNEFAQFQPNLSINSGTVPTPPTGMPEPASMLLALSGLPLIGRFIRRKK